MFLTPLLTTVVFVVGILIGSVGIGGVLLVPALKFLGGISLHTAIPACMLSYMVTGSVGAFIYARHGTINWSMATKVCLGALPGAYIGAFLLPFFRADMLEVFIAVLILASGANSLMRNAVEQQSTAKTEKKTPLLAIGLVAGIGSSLSGTGGPLLLIPILIWFKVPVLIAIGLSQVIQIPISASATVGNFLHGEVDIKLALVLALTMVGGTLLGAKLVHRLPVDSLKKLVAWLLISVALMMLVRFLA
tara:strand:- start:104 stop:847 length:744 start_codon:yes stop_codon:yes gene_type:complete